MADVSIGLLFSIVIVVSVLSVLNRETSPDLDQTSSKLEVRGILNNLLK